MAEERKSRLSVRARLEKALREAIAATGAEAGAATLASKDGNEIIIEAEVGLSADIVGNRFPMDRLSAPGYVMLHRNSITSLNIDTEERFRIPPFILDLGVKSNLSVPMILDGRVIGAMVLDTFSHYEFSQEEVEVVNAIARQTAADLERLQVITELSESHDKMLNALVSALDKRSREAEGHSERVVAYTQALAEKMNVPNNMMKDMRRGALLHDIGKIDVPESILYKSGSLSDDEWVIMKKHPETGMRIIGGIPFLELSSEIVLSHHERWDGEGYPNGLRGKEIPIGARIFSIVDAFDRATSDLPFRKAINFDAACKEIKKGRGNQFDADIVDQFLSFTEHELEIIRERAMGPLSNKDVLEMLDLVEIQRSQTGQLNALSAIIGAITSSLNMKEVLGNTLKALASVTQASSAGVFLYEEDLERMRFTADFEFPKELIQALDRQPIGEFFARNVMLTGETDFFEDISKVEGFEDVKLKTLRPKWQSYICVPLVEKEEIVGVMGLFSEAPYIFGGEDQSLFERVGKQLGQAIINVRIHEDVQNQAFTDPLTGAYNRRFMNDFLDIEVKRSARYKRPLSVIMMDVDHFKKCNDRNGHLAGDKVLVDVVQLMNLGVRTMDMVARYGGEEFLVVLPETALEGAEEAAERIRALIENHDFPCGKLTASFGVAACDYAGNEQVDQEEFIKRADIALLEAKEAGRNRVRCWEAPSEEETVKE